MNRWVAMALLALVGACGDSADGAYHCPAGYLLAPMNMCLVDQDAPPCDCFRSSPFCCAGDACINNAACVEEAWKCETGWRVIDRCDRPAIPATREE